jgi:hypothetical protein
MTIIALGDSMLATLYVLAALYFCSSSFIIAFLSH